jgi:hypothetical protein
MCCNFVFLVVENHCLLITSNEPMITKTLQINMFSVIVSLSRMLHQNILKTGTVKTTDIADTAPQAFNSLKYNKFAKPVERQPKDIRCGSTGINDFNSGTFLFVMSGKISPIIDATHKPDTIIPVGVILIEWLTLWVYIPPTEYINAARTTNAIE